MRFLTGRAKPRRTPTTPRTRRHAVWAPPRSLAATGGISFDFYSRWYSDGSLPSVYRRRTILFMRMRMSSGHSGYPIRKSADHSSYATPRSLSQLYTSFFASTCLGIHRVPLIAYFIWLALPHWGAQGTYSNCLSYFTFVGHAVKRGYPRRTTHKMCGTI